MVESLRRAKQPGLPEMLRSRAINQANAACRLEDVTLRRLTERQRRAVVPPAVWQVALPEARPQAPYVAPEGRAAHKASAPHQTVAPDGPTEPAAAVPQPAQAAARPAPLEGRHERRRRERAERRLAAAARTVSTAIGARGDGVQQLVHDELAAHAATSTMAMAA
jgi:hypothetical protein